MHTAAEPNASQSRWPIRIGWGLNWFLALAVGMGGITDLVKPPFVVEGLTRAGYDERIIVPLGVVTLISAILYAIPRTSVLGAILLTGYFGGAVNTHVRQIGDATLFTINAQGERVPDPVYGPMCMAFAFGVLVWVALYLRMPRLRALAPIVR